jgi:hypothetical protein
MRLEASQRLERPLSLARRSPARALSDKIGTDCTRRPFGATRRNSERVSVHQRAPIPSARATRLARPSGRIDQSAHVRMESVERNDFGPGATPALPNCRVFPAPRAGFKRGQRSFAAGRVDGAVDVLQRRGDRLAVLIGGKLQGLCRKRWTMQV